MMAVLILVTYRFLAVVFYISVTFDTRKWYREVLLTIPRTVFHLISTSAIAYPNIAIVESAKHVQMRAKYNELKA